MEQQQEEKKRRTKGDIVSLVILIVLAVILIPVFAVNLTLIIKGSLNKDVPPDVFGIAPLAVVSPSMDGDREDSFPQGSLIFVRILDEEGKQQLAVGDIVTYRSGETYVTHRITALNTNDAGALASVTTQGDANDWTDGAVLLEDVLGVCTGHIAGLGSFAEFLQTTEGILVVVGVPVVLYIAYDVTRIMLNNRRLKLQAAAAEAEEESEKDAEIRRLRAMLEQKGEEAPAESDAEEGETKK